MKELFLILSIFLLLLTGPTNAQTLNANFKNMVIESKIGKVGDQSYCYFKDGVVEGYQADKIQRIASVTKLLTTLLASETMDLGRKFITKIYVGRDSIHIEGARDPYFEEDKLLLLFQALNELGFKKLKRVSFNQDFLFYDLPLDQYEKITPVKTRARLAAYLSSNNSALLTTTWKGMKKFASEEGIDINEDVPSITAKEVIFSATNPLLNENFEVYDHTSRSLHEILKSMNVQSKNMVAENVYVLASEIKKLSLILNEAGIDPKTYRIYNGSGLPIINGSNRVDNLSSCSTVLKIIKFLSESIKKHNLTLSDVIAVNGGKDLGAFRDRFKEEPQTHGAVLSKTGTLMQTSALAGFLMTDEEIPFAILNHTTNTAKARKFQDHFVASMFDFLGPAVPVDYTKISIFPWDGTEFLTPSPSLILP